MTYLLLQTFLLLLSAYFAGAFCACLMKRAMMTRSIETAAVAERTSPSAQVEYPAEIVPLTKPREIDPVQPRIEVFPRPARKVVPVEEKIDISRFKRALTGPELNEGMPRKMIVELRPAILKSPTGPAVPFKKPLPKAEAPKIEAPKAEAPKPAPPAKALEPTKPVATALAPAKPEPVKVDIKDEKPGSAPPAQPSATATEKPAALPANDKPKNDTPAQETPSSTGASPMMAGIAGASAAAAAAVAAAKAAAASIVPRAQPTQASTPPSAEQTKPTAEKPALEKPNLDKLAPDKPMPAQTATPKVEANAPQPAPTPAPVPTPAAAQPAPSKPAVSEPVPKAEQAQPVAPQPAPASVPAATPPMTGGDDLLRIRAIDAQTATRLNSLGVNRFEQIAHWTPADVNRVNQALGLAGRVDREQWIEQAQILAKGGETYYSRNRGAIVRSAVEPTPPPSGEKQAIASPEANAPPKAASSSPAIAAASVAIPTPQPAAESLAASAQAPSTPAAPSIPASTPAQPSSPIPSMTTAMQAKSVAEMATAAAAAIAAASASVTRGIRPIEPISPLARANPNIVMPAKLSDAIKDNESKAPAEPVATTPAPAKPSGKADDLKRIRGIGVLIEKRLNAIGITTYGQVANWTAADIDRISQMLEFKGRIERESWVEHARILSSGGETEFSRRVDRGDVESSRDDN